MNLLFLSMNPLVEEEDLGSVITKRFQLCQKKLIEVIPPAIDIEGEDKYWQFVFEGELFVLTDGRITAVYQEDTADRQDKISPIRKKIGKLDNKPGGEGA